jgi:cell wall-associated NlpC family hydrolase
VPVRRLIAAAVAAAVLCVAPPAAADPQPDPSTVLDDGFAQIVDPSPELVALHDQVVELSRRAQAAADSHAAAVQRAEQARSRKEAATRAAQRAQARVVAAREALGRYATTAYINGGGPAGVAAALDAADPTDLVTRQNMLNAVADTRADLLRELRDAQEDAAAARARAAAAHARAVAATRAAEQQARSAQQAQDEAQALLDTAVGQALLEQARAAAAASATAAAAARERAAQLAAQGGTAAGAAAVEAAFTHLGKPYQWGGTGPEAFDCSGLTQWAWAAAGVSIPRVSRDQFAALTKVDREDLIPGDLVFFGAPVHHVGMYIGDGLMIHAPKPGDVVRVAPAFWDDYVGAARPGL